MVVAATATAASATASAATTAGGEGSRGKNNHARRCAQFGARNAHRKRLLARRARCTRKSAVTVTRLTRAFNALLCARALRTVRRLPLPCCPRRRWTSGDRGQLRFAAGERRICIHGIIRFAMRGVCTRALRLADALARLLRALTPPLRFAA